MNASTHIAYSGDFTAKSMADVTSTVYNTRCIIGIIAFTMYSLNQNSNACAFESFTLSIGYVNATNGAIIVKNVSIITLLI